MATTLTTTTKTTAELAMVATIVVTTTLTAVMTRKMTRITKITGKAEPTPITTIEPAATMRTGTLTKIERRNTTMRTTTKTEETTKADKNDR